MEIRKLNFLHPRPTVESCLDVYKSERQLFRLGVVWIPRDQFQIIPFTLPLILIARIVSAGFAEEWKAICKILPMLDQIHFNAFQFDYSEGKWDWELGWDGWQRDDIGLPELGRRFNIFVDIFFKLYHPITCFVTKKEVLSIITIMKINIYW